MAKKHAPPKKTSPSTTDQKGDDLAPLEEEIDRQIGDLVPQQARARIVERVTAVLVSERFSGPIAHPRHLREYEQIAPGSADRIITMAEKRNDHHIDMERKLSQAEIDDRKLGMICGAGLFALLIACALVAALFTLDGWISGAFLTATVLGGVGLFIKGRSQ